MTEEILYRCSEIGTPWTFLTGAFAMVFFFALSVGIGFTVRDWVENRR